MLRSFCLVFGLLMIGSVFCSAEDRPAAAAVSLFDGKTLTGWTIENTCEVVVEDGLIVLKSGNGWLRSDRQYTDFTLQVEWKALKAKDYDSGIYVRTLPGGKGDFPAVSTQVNLLEGQEGNIKYLPGTLRPEGLIKPGEWNLFEITCRGDAINLKINQKEAYSVTGLKQKQGHVGLQCEVAKGGSFQFRNITIRDLGK